MHLHNFVTHVTDPNHVKKIFHKTIEKQNISNLQYKTLHF